MDLSVKAKLPKVVLPHKWKNLSLHHCDYFAVDLTLWGEMACLQHVCAPASCQRLALEDILMRSLLGGGEERVEVHV